MACCASIAAAHPGVKPQVRFVVSRSRGILYDVEVCVVAASMQWEIQVCEYGVSYHILRRYVSEETYSGRTLSAVRDLIMVHL